MIEPAIHNLTIFKGGEYEDTFTFEDDSGNAIDLSSYSFRAEIREHQRQTSDLICEITVDDTNASTGILVLSLDNAITLAITQKKGFWDLRVMDAQSKIWYYVKGVVSFQDTVTAEATP